MERTSDAVIKNSFWNFTATVITKVGAMIFTVILARGLMPERYGLFSIVFSVAMIFTALADLGTNDAIIRFSAASIKEKRKESSPYFYLLRVKFFLTLIVSTLFIVLSYPLSTYFFRDSRLLLPFVIAAMYVFIFSFDLFFMQIFYAVEKVKYIGIRELLNQGLRVSCVILLFFLINRSYHIVGVFLLLSMISLILVLVSAGFLYKKFPALFVKHEKIDKKRINKFIFYFALVSFSGAMFSYADAIVLGRLVPLEYVGYYKVSLSLVLGVAGILSFANPVLLSVFSRFKGEQNGIIFNKALKYISILTIPAVFGVVLIGKYLLVLLYGHEYIGASFLLSFLAPIIFFAVFFGLVLSVFSAEEKLNVLAKLAFIVAILNILLNILLIKILSAISPLWAAAGASIANIVSWSFYLFLLFYHMKKEISIKINLANLIKPLVASIFMSAVIVLIIKLFREIDYFSGFLLIITGIIAYLIFLSIIGGIRKEDIHFLKQIIFRSSQENLQN